MCVCACVRACRYRVHRVGWKCKMCKSVSFTVFIIIHHLQHKCNQYQCEQCIVLPTHLCGSLLGVAVLVEVYSAIRETRAPSQSSAVTTTHHSQTTHLHTSLPALVRVGHSYMLATLYHDIVVHQLSHELMLSLVVHIYTDGTYLRLLSNAVPQLSQFYNSKHSALFALDVRVQCTRYTDALTAWYGVCNAHTV